MNPNHTGRAIVSRQRIGSITHVRIAGAIDETFSLQTVGADLVGHVLIDLGQLERISSFGVRKWIEFVSKLPVGAMDLYVIHAPPIVVDQLNMVEGFAGISKVLSLLAPYRCDACKEERVRLVDLQSEKEVLARGEAPSHTCPVCSGALVFADIPAEFFDFARNQQLQTIDPVVNRYLSSLSPANVADDTSTLKFIEGDVTYFRMGGVIKADINVRRMSAGLEGRVVYDFGTVRVVEEGADSRLVQIITTAANSAQVYLTRLPPPVLLGLAKQRTSATVTTLNVPAECRNCGSKVNEQVEAALYLAWVTGGDPMERPCQICGGLARLPRTRELAQALTGMNMGAAPAELTQLEQRALSQYLSTPSPEMTPTKNGGSGDVNASSQTRLQILKHLGRGGMAEVFLARQQGVKGFEKYVVVKKILGQFAQSADFVEMLFAEARANARLTHPNIVQTFDVGMMDGVAYITMEYVRGPDVKRAVAALRRKGVALPIQHAIRIVAETAAGLHYAHSYVDPTGKPHPMVHRDVSPHNVLLSLDGAIKLSDFGIAKVQGESEHTQAGVLKGKIAYVSPEAISGMPLDARNDVFALGVVLYELLTGRLPFKRENDAATLRAIVRETPPSPTEVNPSVPQDISNIVLWALEKDAARRIQTAAQLREALEQAMVRNGLASSPSAVAEFFKQALSQELAEYGPIQASAQLSVTPPSAQPVPPPPMAPAAPETGSISLVEVVDAPEELKQPNAGAVLGHLVNPGARREGDEHKTSAIPPPVLQPEPPTVTTPGKLVQPPVAQRPAPAPAPAQAARPQPSPVPAPAPRAAPAPVAQPVAKPAPAPAPPVAAAVPKPPPVAPPRTQSAQLPTEPYVPVQPERRSNLGKIAAALGAVVLIAAGGALAWPRLMGGKVSVSNLEAGEALYINGVQVEPSALELQGASLIVAVARDGKLARFGTADSREGIDARALVAAPEATAAAKGTLVVDSDPKGCVVKVGNETLPSLTPTTSQIPAGQEVKLSVSCSSRAPWTRSVLAIPDQHIEVSALPAAN